MEIEEAYRTALASGKSDEEILGYLHRLGATPVEVIKAIYIVKGVSLGQAKSILGNSQSWSKETKAADNLHQEVLSELQKDT